MSVTHEIIVDNLHIKKLTQGELAGTIYMYVLSVQEWIDSELFTDWFVYHFLEHSQQHDH